jgi:hypothetical protein
VIKSRLVITTPNVVIRGAGQDVTTLYFPKSMTDLYGNKWVGHIMNGTTCIAGQLSLPAAGGHTAAVS